MNIQEREQLTQFLQQLTQVQAAQKDSEAESLIRDACIRQPDATYLLVQRAMLLDQAMNGAQAQITRLQGELDQVRAQARTGNGNSSFLDPNAWGNASVSRTASMPQTPIPSQAPFASPVAAPAASAWGSGMLGNIATTAAGVVAGGFLFQGIEHLMGNHGSNSGLMNGLSSNALPEHHEAAAINPLIDDSDSSSGLFDTSSVDSFIDTDNS
jgi:uncharacterized protein